MHFSLLYIIILGYASFKIFYMICKVNCHNIFGSPCLIEQDLIFKRPLSRVYFKWDILTFYLYGGQNFGCAFEFFLKNNWSLIYLTHTADFSDTRHPLS